jgi:DNA polymerase-1
MLVTIDFETLPIRGRPDDPPEPVGVALHADGIEPHYFAWGHELRWDSSRRAEAMTALDRVWRDPRNELLFYNAKFDVGVATERCGLPMPPWERIHDAMFQVFLADPYASSWGLKPSAARLLDLPPDEQDALAAWVRANKAMLEARYPWAGKVQARQEGKWIFATPEALVRPYALGDVIRTRGLYDRLTPLLERQGMTAAYDRERQLMPILLQNERDGMRVDMAGLERDCEDYGRAFEFVEDQLRTKLRASGLNFDADQDVAAVLVERGVVPLEAFTTTKNGGLSMSKANLLPEAFTGPDGAQVASALGYRNRLATCLKMFMQPWREQGSRRNGVISTEWNQIRGDVGGTKTGRPSTHNPNFLNISKSFMDRDDQYAHPAFLSVPELPRVRRYILADEGHVLLDRDFDGQELRVFAHFEKGALWDAYQADPSLDPHAFVGAELMIVAQRELARLQVKTLNFQSLYGGGVPALQRQLRCTRGEAQELKAFHDRALPGRRVLVEEITRTIRRGDPIRTWGGRLYFAPPRMADGREALYKLINYEVQGSAADFTKETIIQWDAHNKELGNRDRARFLLQVYDELLLSAPQPLARPHMRMLKDVMEQPRLSVPMRSSGKSGLTWGDMTKWDDHA